MQLVIVFFILFMLFFVCLIISAIVNVKIMEKWQALLVSSIGVIVYGILFGLVCYNEFKVYNVENDKTNVTNNKSISTRVVKNDVKTSDTTGQIIGDTDSKIYHVPGSTYYEREKKKKSNNVYFNTIEEAEKAGYRAPKR